MKGSVKIFLLYAVPALVVIGLVAYRIVRPTSVDKVGNKLKPTPDPVVDEAEDEPVVDLTRLDRATRELVLGCTTDMATTFHIHPLLAIFVDDKALTISADIGIVDQKCMYPIHTHDGAGKTHVESPKPANFTLGDFFLVWGKKFDELGTLEKMTVNGTDSTEGENLILMDDDKIVLRYTLKSTFQRTTFPSSSANASFGVR